MINKLSMIIALDEEGGFSKDYQIPWKNEPIFKKDQKRFKELTKNNAVLMGRHTYEEIHQMKIGRGVREDGPLLRERTSFVLSRNPEFKPLGVIKADSFLGLLRLEEIENPEVVQCLFVIGGLKLCIETLPRVTDVYCTIVKGYYNCEKKFPIQEFKKFQIIEGNQTDDAYFIHYVRK